MSSLKNKSVKFLLALARLRLMRPWVKIFFNHMDRFLSAERLYENEHWVGFKHPQPDYPLHILILPKRSITSLTGVSLDSVLFTQLFEAVQKLAADFELEKHGYRLITNGGPNQTIPQWHWHLISDHYGETDA